MQNIFFDDQTEYADERDEADDYTCGNGEDKVDHLA
jgi:hypothetical protein